MRGSSAQTVLALAQCLVARLQHHGDVDHLHATTTGFGEHLAMLPVAATQSF